MSDALQLPPADHEPPARGRMLLAAVMVLLVLASAVGVAWALMRNRPAESDTARPAASSAPAEACPEPELRVAAAPEIAPVVREAADRLNTPGQRCRAVEVTAEEPGITAASTTKPDVWIPSSGVWLRAAGAGYTISGAPLAYSPIVLAAPKPILDLFAKEGRTSWNALTEGMVSGQIPVASMPDALRSTTGLLSVYGVRTAAGRAIADPGIAQLRAFTLRSRLENAATDPATLLDRLAGQTDASAAIFGVGAFPVTEQQLTLYQRGGHPIELGGAVPADGPVEAEYPFAVHEDAPKDLARSLRTALGPEVLAAAGFRTAPSGTALSLPDDVQRLFGPARQWMQYRTMAFQVLLLVDASGSMNDKIPGRTGANATKAALLRQSGAAAAQLFGTETSLGMWYFGATATGPAHTEQVPFGPIAEQVGGTPRRELIAEKISGYRAVPAASTPLFQTVLDGVADMRGRVRPDTATVVVVLTDGDDRGSRFAMSQETFLKRLADGNDARRPVPIIAVGFGPTANMTVLRAMASATGGKAIAAQDPADLASAVAEAFLAARGAS